jgi:hypothetical protein
MDSRECVSRISFYWKTIGGLFNSAIQENAYFLEWLDQASQMSFPETDLIDRKFITVKLHIVKQVIALVN